MLPTGQLADVQASRYSRATQKQECGDLERASAILLSSRGPQGGAAEWSYWSWYYWGGLGSTHQCTKFCTWLEIRHLQVEYWAEQLIWCSLSDHIPALAGSCRKTLWKTCTLPLAFRSPSQKYPICLRKEFLNKVMNPSAPRNKYVAAQHFSWRYAGANELIYIKICYSISVLLNKEGF